MTKDTLIMAIGQSIMVVVGPGYLSPNSLPYASDIFYHRNLIYLLPTGFHPIELHSVSEFPRYCYDHSIALPEIIWEMCEMYFENTSAAKEAFDIIEPLKGRFISIITTIYPRDITAITDTQRLLIEYPLIEETFQNMPFDIRLAARELLSHVLYEVFIEEGFEGAVEYLRVNSEKPEQFLRLIAAVLLNRLRRLPFRTLLLYEHAWLPLLNQINNLHLFDKPRDSPVAEGESFDIEHFRYKIFETILLPIFGRCDSQKKSHAIAEVADKKCREIEDLKGVCGTIAREVVLLPTSDFEIKQRKLSDMVSEYLIEPLSAIVERRSNQVQSMLRDFILDSTVIAGLLALLQGDSVATMGTAVAAGAISTGARYILQLKSQQKVTPSDLLVMGMEKMGVTYEQVERYLNSITMQQVTLPKDWNSLA